MGANEIERRQNPFQRQLASLKAAHGEIPWYPYDSLSFVPLLQALLKRMPGDLTQFWAVE